MNLDKVIEAFQQGGLQIDLLDMELTQNKAGEDAIVYKGKGYIRQTEDDVLLFRLYADEARNTSMAKSFNTWHETNPGKLYADTSYYTLKALASDGTTWTAEQILPEPDWLGGHSKPIAHGKLRSCVRTENRTITTPRTLGLYFFEKADLPTVFEKTSFEAQGCMFEIEKGDENFCVKLKSEQPLTEHFDTRIEETLRFILAQSVQTRAIVRGNQLELFSKSSRSTRTALNPPIARGSSASMDNSWQLFTCYLDYITRETKTAFWNPLSGHLHNALEASANSIDAWAIGIGVAVEGIANLLPYQLPDDQKIRMRELQKFIAKQVKDSETHKQYSERVQSLVAGLTSVRAIDKMQWLVKQSGTSNAHVQAWKNLRNRNVHPSGKIDVASLDYQRLIDDLHTVSVLLYHLVFHIIGYKGSYTDYATYGFPKAEYPSPEPEHLAKDAVVDHNKIESGESSSSFRSTVAWLTSLVSKARHLLPCQRPRSAKA